MEEVLARFPHLGDKIFQNLDSYSLIRCKEASRTWGNFMKVEKSCYLRIIQWYTYRPKSLVRKIAQQFGAPIIVVSILREIFGSNRALPIGWEENCMPAKKMNQWGRATAAETEGRKYYMNHITKSTQWEDPRITISHGSYQNSQHAQTSKIATSPPPYGFYGVNHLRGPSHTSNFRNLSNCMTSPYPSDSSPAYPNLSTIMKNGN